MGVKIVKFCTARPNKHIQIVFNNQKMETAEQIRIKLAEMRLAALETEFCNTNWTFNLKIKALKEELHIKNRRQMELNAELVALRQIYTEHQNQIKNALAQAALLRKQEEENRKSPSRSPYTRETVSRKNHKDFSKRLFFNVDRQETKKMFFSPNISKTPATTSWQNLRSNNDQTHINPEKRDTIIVLKENYSLRSIDREKKLESANMGHLRRGSGELTIRIEDRNVSGKWGRRRQDKRGSKGF